MLQRLTRDWPVYIMLAGIICFIIYAFINSHKEQKKMKNVQKEIDKQHNK